ncbi:MAG: hypothetical protein AAB401_07200 [Acidobacteriota bacterium]
MKHLLGICACLFIATWQQEAPPKPAPSIQPTAEALMKAQTAADKALAKRDEDSTEELKKLVEREIAKSAALPVTTTVQEPVKLTVKLEFKTSVMMVDGSPYLRIGNIVVAMPGSECFLPEDVSAARFQRAQAKLTELMKAEAQSEPVKKN